MTLDLDTLREVIAGTAAAFRCVTDYQPAGGPGDKVFPPTYEGGKYATEERIDPATGERKPCVLLDSVQSQANRMELALLEAHRAGKVTLPLIVTTFDQPELLKRFTVTSLFGLCPAALVFGLWDSTGPRGGLGAKFPEGAGFRDRSQFRVAPWCA